MTQLLAINGSPNKHRGMTGQLLSALLEGAQAAGATCEVICANELTLKSCRGELYCWYRQPGRCYLQDDMQALYPRLWAADTLLLATPVYAPLPGAMQTVLNRLMPLMLPELTLRDGRTRARMRQEVTIQRVALLATGGWWEPENLSVVTHIVQEMAANASLPFAGAALRPHASTMRRLEGGLTSDGQAVLAAVRQAGRELVELGAMQPATLEAIQRPLLPEVELRRLLNARVSRAWRRSPGPGLPHSATGRR